MAWAEQKTLENWILKASSERFSCGIHSHSLRFFSPKWNSTFSGKATVGGSSLGRKRRKRGRKVGEFNFVWTTPKRSAAIFLHKRRPSSIVPCRELECSQKWESLQHSGSWFFTISFATHPPTNRCERWTVENWKFNLFNAGPSARFSSQFLMMS